MKYILWVMENGGRPRVLGYRDKLIVSTGMARYSTRMQFENIVGSAKAKAALSRYEEEKNTH